MEKTTFIIISTITIFLLSASLLFAEEDAYSGRILIKAATIGGKLDSAKFEEYGHTPEGVSGSAWLSYDKKTYFFDIKAEGFSEDDQSARLRSGIYGKYKIEAVYDKLPHRFAYGAKSLYAGAGSGSLVLSDSLQSDLNKITSASAGDLTGDKKTNGRDAMVYLANKLNSYLDGASALDLGIYRKTGKVNLDITAFFPLNIRAEFKREERDGTRPFSGAFGFGGAFEIPEPVDYDTTETRITAEFARKEFYVSGSYRLSIFENNISTLSWENPMRITDSTSSTAYSNPSAGSSPNYVYSNNGPVRGLIDLYPDNIYHNVSLSGSVMKLPLKSRLAANASMGWMRQDDAFLPYTTNTSITSPLNAWDPAVLPQSSPDAKVNTSLYNVLLTTAPVDLLRVKVKYRYFKHDNKTDHIEFPGWVRTDAVWEEERDANGNVVNISTEPTSYTNKTIGADLGIKVPALRATNLSLGYAIDSMERSDTREVAESDDKIITLSADTSPINVLTLRAAYELAKREGDYDYTAPFHTIMLTGSNPPQLPFLRKYDEADRDRNRITFMASLNPFEAVTLGGSVTQGKDDFKDSPFGLIEDTHLIYNLDASFSPVERLDVSAFYGREKYENTQKARQWTPGGTNDPYIKDTTYDSNGNWEAVNTDTINSLGGKLKVAVLPTKLDIDLSYLYQKSDGKISLTSPLGTAADDSNPATPIDFDNVDDTKKHTLSSRIKYRFSKSLSLAVGHMWEKFEAEDFDIEGFAYAPKDSSGLYIGSLFMGTYLKDYEANVLYSKLIYSF